jgi:hypothetical protein
MAGVAGQDREAAELRGGGDRHVREPWRMALAVRPIGKGAGDTRCLHLERQDALRVEMQNGIEPSGETVGLAPATLPTEPGDPGLDLGDQTAER